MLKPYPAIAVANYFLDLAEEERKPLNPMQVQKLAYFAHGWYLALTNQPLVDEQVEAWKFGPVFPSLYQQFKEYGGGAILGRAREWHLDVNPATGRKTILRQVVPTLDDDPDATHREHAKTIVKRVWDVYGSWSALQLSQLTHVPGGPWEITRSKNPDRLGTDIPDTLIRAEFLRKAGQKA